MTYFYKSPTGILKIKEKDNYITYLKFISEKENKEHIKYEENNEKLKVENKNVSKPQLIKKLEKELDEYFLGQRQNFTVPVNPNGTEFQKEVWKALTKIKYGETKSYKDIANIINNPKAYRAVGNANNKNPISILIPCHRVIGSSGKMVGYASGIQNKIYLLNLEKGKTT